MYLLYAHAPVLSLGTRRGLFQVYMYVGTLGSVCQQECSQGTHSEDVDEVSYMYLYHLHTQMDGSG